MGKTQHRKPTIQIEMDGSLSSAQNNGEMSPAQQANRGFQKAAKKMGAVGNETKFPRDDNFFMGK